MGELSEYAGNICQNGADYVVMGHYHQAKEVKLTSGKLIVLGDWIRYNTFAVFDGDNLSLNYWR
jgi:UDP-2,3-diacylglucosamine hydrolase